MKDHNVVLVGDFNAKLNVEKGTIRQTQSNNGERLRELMLATNLEAVSLMSEQGMWTRVNRARTEERSIIDYVVADESAKKHITKMSIDEEEQYRLKNSQSKWK